MAEFQWWLLFVGLIAGGGLVAVVTMDGRRREEDIVDLERRAEAQWIADRATTVDGALDAGVVASVLELHREYLALPPPDEILVEGEGSGDAADEIADEVRDHRGRRADEDLATAGEDRAAAGQEAHPGADRE
jgi:hypothetical protein